MQTRHKLMIMALVFSLILLALGQKCHALSDFAGQGKAPLTWDELMQPRVDPSRYFAVPNGGHGDHPAGGYDAPQAVARAKPDQTVKPDSKTDPNPPHIPMVRPPKPQPEVKPEVKPEPKPDCKPRPEVKPEPHKCWHFKLRTPKPDCKHETAKPDKKPSCSKVGDHKKSECAKPDHMGPTTSNPGKYSSCGKLGGLRGSMGPGMKGHGLGHRGGHHGVGKGRR